ncbi:MAG TPA: EAL domain-containing protein [Trichocoleus sp.]
MASVNFGYSPLYSLNLGERAAIRLLVVESEPGVACKLQTLLKSLGYTVLAVAESGEQALQAAEEFRPDLVLIDVPLLGPMDGFATAAEIRTRYAIPSVYLTASVKDNSSKQTKPTDSLAPILDPCEARELQILIESTFYKHHLETSLDQQNRWLITILQSLSEGVIAADPQGYITFINPQAEAMTGWNLEEAMHRPINQVLQFFHEDTQIPLDDPFTPALQSGVAARLPSQIVLVHRDGHQLPIKDCITPIYHQGGELAGMVVVIQDVSNERLMEGKLRYQALHDLLTDLPNRTYFLDRLQEELERSKRSTGYQFAVLFLDLDRFKAINDSLGHSVGDRLLATVAQTLNREVRALDLVARLGGDEFALILADVRELWEACQIAQRLVNAIAQPMQIGRHQISTSVSIGLLLSSPSHPTAESLLQASDIAMYRAKRQGGNRYEVFDNVVGDQIKARLHLENGLRQALEQSELRTFYQPIVSLQSGQTVGVEALLRWQRGQELLLPDSFLEVAMESKLISAMDWWMLRESCEQFCGWQKKIAAPNWISVNFSNHHFNQPNCVEQLASILAQTGLDPACLKLEITEDTMIQQPEKTKAILTELRSLGVRLLLDDFGTGFASLSYLHQFPLDGIKIDRSFIHEMGNSSQSQEIVRTLVLLAQALNLEVIAEGVETPLQKQLLQDLHCPLAQGYFFCPPFSSEGWGSTL